MKSMQMMMMQHQLAMEDEATERRTEGGHHERECELEQM